jgi:integrase/recombinase XerD
MINKDLNKFLKDINRLDNLQTFFEREGISDRNQEITLSYLMSIKLEGRSEATLKNNIWIMKFILEHTSADLDNLTNQDIDSLVYSIETWDREDGKERSSATKKQYKIGLKRFLKHYGERNDLTELAEKTKRIKVTGAARRKLPEDLLKPEEVNMLISAATNTRDKAIMAVFYESGGRLGEHLKCRIKDIEWNEYGCNLTFHKSKTDARKIQLVYCASFLRQWLEVHPFKDNREAPLWVTLQKRESREDKLKRKQGIKKEKEMKYLPLDKRAVSEMLYRVGESVGVKSEDRRFYAHLFRHSRATDLAKVWGESKLKMHFGWAPNSGMPSVYVHLSNRDMQDSVLELYGLRDKRNEFCLEVDKCPRCKAIVNADATYCDKCGMPLVQDMQQTINTTTSEFTSFIDQHPELVKMLMTQMQINLNQNCHQKR